GLPGSRPASGCRLFRSTMRATRRSGRSCRSSRARNPSMPVPAETATGSGAAGGVEAVYARIARRIMPVLILLFVIAWLDRANIGFARLQMLADRAFSDAVFGFGAGVFYF